MSVKKPKAPGPSESERALAQVALQKWKRFKEQGIPVERAYLGMVSRWGSNSSRAAAAGKGAATVQAGMTPVTAMTRPYNPGSARFIGERVATAAATGAGRGAGAVSADAGETARGDAGRIQLLRMGRNLDAMAMGNLARQGALETSRAIADAYASQAERNAMMEAIGTAAGIGAAGYMNRQSVYRPSSYRATDLGLSDVPYSINI